MNSIDFEHRTFPFAEFNPVQSAAIPHVEHDVNMVIASPTATGKTVIAECLMAFESITHPGCKSIYMSPLKSLSGQKHEEWSRDHQFSEIGVELITGDSDGGKADECGIIVTTIECFDSRVRSGAFSNIVEASKVLIVDEAHIIGSEDRGDHAESALMRFSQRNPGARIVLLSATVSNSTEIASWVKSLNGKDTIKIASSWRPSIPKVMYVERDGSYKEDLNTALDSVRQAKHGDKTIVFVHSKRFGRDLCDRIKRAGIQCAFHNADLQRNKRKMIEQAFNSKIGGLDVLVSTSTLSMGVNIA